MLHTVRRWRSRLNRHAMPASAQDPRIATVELRRQVELERARLNLLLTGLVVLALVVVQVVLTVGHWRWNGLIAAPLAFAAAALGVMWDRWMRAGAAMRRSEDDVKLISTLFHESPRHIRRWLTREFVDDSIQNLLAANLDSDELAASFWDQAINPFIAESARGFKSDWRYQIDLVDLDEDVVVRHDDADPARFAVAEHRSLRTTLQFAQRVFDPSALHYVGAVFCEDDLPSWFGQPNFLLREVIDAPQALVDHLAAVSQEIQLPGSLDAVAEKVSEHPHIALAEGLLGVSVRFGEHLREPKVLRIDRTGVAWGFAFDEVDRQALQSGCTVRIDVQTYVARSRRSFPVVIASPTQNPRIEFRYVQTDIARVDTDVCFAAKRPWDPRLQIEAPDLRRIEVITEPDDWVFAGSGCIFRW